MSDKYLQYVKLFSLHSSTLTLTLIRLGDLSLRLDTGFPPDPLVEFEVKYAHDGKIKSEVYQSTSDPHMYESFRFEVPVNDLGNQTLTFKVIDMMQTNIPEPPPPPEPEEGKKKKKTKDESPPPPPPPPPPSPALIGFVTVPLVSVAMKKLLADTEITILRDVIKLKPRRSLPEKTETTGGETVTSTTGTGTGTDDFEDAQETVEDEEKKDEEKEKEVEEPEEQDEPDTSQVRDSSVF